MGTEATEPKKACLISPSAPDTTATATASMAVTAATAGMERPLPPPRTAMGTHTQAHTAHTHTQAHTPAMAMATHIPVDTPACMVDTEDMVDMVAMVLATAMAIHMVGMVGTAATDMATHTRLLRKTPNRIGPAIGLC